MTSNRSGDRPGIDRPITRDDIESRLRSFRSELDTVKGSTEGVAAAVAVGGGVLLVILSFLLGRRRGRRKYAFVEVRRV